ncbi:bifunctional polysaccharide deacetylase/glycosyltransferase family 2 protein [Streptacidiphilus sp. ASG 303]|uniref:bifunctional polysaccharide deacetylase/glycosyltransferase family 2 protein n=1 Tax=Streptacidiphilus sp. ASG 303 TaxID=2896847 RepID=UPI001E38243D|nr:bifunctional polysaccharide deacetylase/glycosyltransferase family 2 protein [Streptacidiphilus sp. ASG 303]MCD0481435.1 bifunctional polysaccharide deacetylase/glycosyltransferase family 2 protein [Streptacidiphilus sp. ASG 303]
MHRHRRHRAAARTRRRSAPPLRFLLPSLVMVALMGLLLLRGLVTNEVFHDSRVAESVDKTTVPRHLLTGGPVVDSRHGRQRSYRPADRTVALTFDDGPDPVWTPRVLDILAKHHARATFFVTGAMVSRHPALVRRIVAEGHEVGVHTFDHPDLALQSDTRLSWELAQTQLALAGAAGIHSSLFRPPYSSRASALDDLTWPVVRKAGARGYVTAFIDTDTDDWKRPGVDAIVRAALPRHPGEGAVVLMHDSGGDRSQTVAALDRLMPLLEAEHYRFTTVSGSLGAPSAHTAVSGFPLWSGRVFIGFVSVSVALLPVLVALLAVVGGLVLARFALMLALSFRHVRRTRADGFSWGPPVTAPVTVLVPAYNERECIAHTVRSLARSDHPVEVVVVDDGSTDGTAAVVEALGLPGVRVVRQANAGKAAALDTGLAHASHDLVVMVDGDTVFEPSTVRELVQPFADPRIGAVAGNAKVGNRDTLIGAWQHIEYVMGFNLDRRMYDVLGCIPTIPGAVGAYRRSALAGVGGMSDDTLAEDTDVTMALHRAGWRIVYAEDARAWTEAPQSMDQLWSQRYRWSYGTMQAMWKHRHAVLERGTAGRFGRVGLPLVALFTVVAPLLAPLIDVFLLYGMVFVDLGRTLLAWLAVLAVQAVCAGYAFRLDRERPWHLVSLPIQQVVYRQLMYLVLLQSWITALTGGRLRWQKLRRTGEVEAPVAAV